MADNDPLRRLQDWYLSHCNGNWEHTYSIEISTLDNPGWRLKVELKDTDLYDRPFDDVILDGENKNDWYQCKVLNHDFEAHCGPARLNDVITIFLNWANHPASLSVKAREA
jgi:hypothetical protein